MTTNNSFNNVIPGSFNGNLRQLYANDGTTIKMDYSNPSATNFNSANGLEFQITQGAGTVVNYTSINGAPTGNTPIWQTLGADASIGITFMAKGAGGYDFTSGTGTVFQGVNVGAGAFNNINISNSTTGNAPLIQAGGLDTNVDFLLKGQGTGNVRLGNAGLKYPNADGSVNYVMKTDAAGNLSFANVNTLVTSVSTEEVFVSLQGNDTTGTGTQQNPWATIAHAQASISPTTTSRYVIWLTPGFYPENVSLIANCFIAATAPVETRLTGNLDINNTTWNTAGVDNRSGLINLEHRTGTTTFDFTAQAGNDSGKLYLSGCRWSDQPVITGLSTGQANQVVFTNCYFFAGVSNNGAVVQIVDSYNAGGTYTNFSSASASRLSDMEILGGVNDGNYSNVWTANSNITMEIEGVGFGTGTTVTVSGASAVTTANRASLPDNSKITISSGGTLVVDGGIYIGIKRAYSLRGTPAFSTVYTPSTTNDVMVIAVVQMVTTVAQSSTISAQVNTGAGLTTIAQASQQLLASTGIQTLSFVVPANSTYQLLSAGTGTNTIVTINELLL